MSNPLKAYRLKNEMSQQEVADRLGVSRAMVGHLENGDRDFTADMAVLIEQTFGIARVLIRPDLFRRT